MTGKLTGKLIGVPKSEQAAELIDTSHKASAIPISRDLKTRWALVKFGCVQP
jgi:hypothetical protein